MEYLAASEKWQAEGQRLRQAKSRQRAKAQPGPSDSTPGNLGDFAYQSAPVDITGNGVYKFVFGPLEDSFNFPKDPSGLSFNLPTDMGFIVGPAGGDTPGIEVVTRDGARYLEVYLEVRDFKSEYRGLTAWAY